jgi:hypothetical protein
MQSKSVSNTTRTIELPNDLVIMRYKSEKQQLGLPAIND